MDEKLSLVGISKNDFKIVVKKAITVTMDKKQPLFTARVKGQRLITYDGQHWEPTAMGAQETSN